jgi:hypothetical protein
MRDTRLIACSMALLAGAACLPTRAAVVWDEAVSGDLSNNGLAPTALSVALGDNGIVGSMGDGGSGVDRDYFTFTVPVGAQLLAIRINDGTFVSGSLSFMAIQAGPQVTTTPTGNGVEALLGHAHYEGADAGSNFLPRLVQSHPELGGLLPSGTYSIWVQETGGTVFYDYTLVISSVPEPANWGLFTGGLLLLGKRPRQAARQTR